MLNPQISPAAIIVQDTSSTHLNLGNDLLTRPTVSSFSKETYFLAENPLIASQYIWQNKQQNKEVHNMIYLARMAWLLPHVPVPLGSPPCCPPVTLTVFGVLRHTITLLPQDLTFAPICLEVLLYPFYLHSAKSHFQV